MVILNDVIYIIYILVSWFRINIPFTFFPKLLTPKIINSQTNFLT